MVDIEELKQRFVVKPCPPWGNCIIIPGSEFRKSWERELYDDKNINCVHTDFGNINRPVVLVRLDPAEASEAPESSTSDIPQPEAGLQRVLKGKNTPLGPRWTEDEYKLLITLWNEHKKVREIATNFPKRSGHAVACALARLKNSGAIKPRWTTKKNLKKEQAVEAEVETPQQPQQSQEPQEHPSEPLKPNIVCNVSIHVMAKSAASIKAIITLLKELKAK